MPFQIFDDNENVISCDYYSIKDLNKFNIKNHELYKMHLHISSLTSHIDDAKKLLVCWQQKLKYYVFLPAGYQKIIL